MSDIPQSWVYAGLLDVSTLVRGVTYTKSDAQQRAFSGSIPVIRANNIQDRRFDLNELVYVPSPLVSSTQRVGKGDVVVATSSGSISVVGKAAQASSDMNAGFGAFCGLLRPSNEINAKYFGHFFSTEAYRSAVSAMARGVNINNLKREHFESLAIPLAPINEQKCIADKLDAVLARVDACRERLDRVPAILKRFRQSVLAAATCGKLTEEWRSDVLEEYPDVHNSWRTLMIKDLVATDGLFSDGDWIESKDQDPEGNIRLIQLADIGDGVFLDKSRRFINEEAFVRIRCTELLPGDILVARMPDPLGRACIFPDMGRRCITAVDVAILRPANANVNNQWLVYAINAPSIRSRMNMLASGTTRQRVTRKSLGDIELDIPSIYEQNEIVRRVNELFSYADRLEARYTTARAQVEKLTPALLAKAFRGELVPQDPKDEPASVLLQRIRAARATEAERPKRELRGKRKIKAEVIMLDPANIPADHLTQILKRRGRLSAKALWQASELEIEYFYEQLRLEEKKGRLREIRKTSESYLEVA